MKRIKAACLEQTIHFMLKEDLPHDEAVQFVKAEYEHYLPSWSGTGPSTAFWRRRNSRTALCW